jgi:hypothetical protein
MTTRLTLPAFLFTVGSAGALAAGIAIQPAGTPPTDATPAEAPAPVAKDAHAFRLIAVARIQNEATGNVTVRTETIPIRASADRARAIAAAEAARWARSFTDAPGQRLLSWTATAAGPLADSAGTASNPDRPPLPRLDPERDVAFITWIGKGDAHAAKDTKPPADRAGAPFWITAWNGGPVILEMPGVPAEDRDEFDITLVSLTGPVDTWTTTDDTRTLGAKLRHGDRVLIPGPAAGELGAPALAVHSRALASSERGAWVIAYRD